MYNLKKNTYVVVEFTEINGHFSGIYDSRTKQDLSFASSPIIEIAAVKIQKGEISEHYTKYEFYRFRRRSSKKFMRRDE